MVIILNYLLQKNLKFMTKKNVKGNFLTVGLTKKNDR